jgi:hypothetical protein
MAVNKTPAEVSVLSQKRKERPGGSTFKRITPKDVTVKRCWVFCFSWTSRNWSEELS